MKTVAMIKKRQEEKKKKNHQALSMSIIMPTCYIGNMLQEQVEGTIQEAPDNDPTSASYHEASNVAAAGSF
jgi:hypothetical protein